MTVAAPPDAEGKIHYPLLPLPGAKLRCVLVIGGENFPLTLRAGEVEQIVLGH